MFFVELQSQTLEIEVFFFVLVTKKFFVPNLFRGLLITLWHLCYVHVKASILFDMFFKLVAISTIQTDTCVFADSFVIKRMKKYSEDC